MQQSRPSKVVEVRCGFDEGTTYDPWYYAPVLARKPSTKSLIHRHTPSFLIKIKQPRKASAGQKEPLIELSTKSPAGYFDGNMIRGTHGDVCTCRQSSAAIPSAYGINLCWFSAPPHLHDVRQPRRIAIARRFHKGAAFFQGIAAAVGLLGLVADHMRQRRFDQLARMTGFISGPIAEAGSETVNRRVLGLHAAPTSVAMFDSGLLRVCWVKPIAFRGGVGLRPPAGT
jgi:hypothetical protein